MIDYVIKKIKSLEGKNVEYTAYPQGGDSFGTIIIHNKNSSTHVIKYSHNQPEVKRLCRVYRYLKKMSNRTTYRYNIPYVINYDTKPDYFLVQLPVPGSPIHLSLKSNINSPISCRSTVETIISETFQSLKNFHLNVYNDNSSLAQSLSVNNHMFPDHVPSGPMHGDFVLTNVLSDSSDIYVIDWGQFMPKGCPFVDVFSFLVSLSYYLFSSYHVRRVFYYDSWYSRLVSRELLNYSKCLDVSISNIRKCVKPYFKYSMEYSLSLGNLELARTFYKLKRDHRSRNLTW